MANPTVVNRRPAPGETEVDVATPFRFGVRDQDTRADLTTIYSSAVYGLAVYAPGELPSNDDTLEDAGASLYFSTFDDASGTTEPKNPCDQTIEDVSGSDVYRIEKSDLDGVPQEGVLFITLDAQDGDRPYEFSARIDLPFTSTDTFDYVTFSGFTGVLMGFVYWPESTGVFLFFVDDGTKKVTVAGPAEDGVGTRSVSETAVFDWSAEAYTYSVLWDPTPYRRKVMVFATDSSGDETLLAEIDMDTLPQFLTSVRMGRLYAEDSPSTKVTMVLGGDFPDQGNYIDVYGFTAFTFGRVLVVGGAPTGASSLNIEPTESVLAVGADGLSEWSEEGSSGSSEQTEATTKITASASPYWFTREEPDLQAGEWMLIGKVAGGDSTHAGYYYTGMGVMVEDGTRAFKLHFLDDFSRNTIGIEESDAADDDVLEGYKVPSEDVDWEATFDFTLLGMSGRDELKLFVDDDVTAVVEHTYTAPGYPASTAEGVTFGFLESGDFSGDFYLAHLWVFPNCIFYNAAEATYPESQGWSRDYSAGASRSLSGGQLELDSDSAGEHDIYYIEDSTYDATSGAAAIFRAEVAAWTDASGSSSPPRSEFGPIAAVRTTTVAAQVFFVQAAGGETYVYLSQQSSDVSDVLAQNEAGRALSAEIDLSEAHSFILDVKPYQYIRLYIDYDPEPAIEVLWASSSEGLRSLPTNMPATAVVAVGSLGEDTGVQVTFDFFRASIGTGYDLRVQLDVAEAELQDNVYGADVDLFIDVQDED